MFDGTLSYNTWSIPLTLERYNKKLKQPKHFCIFNHFWQVFNKKRDKNKNAEI